MMIVKTLDKNQMRKFCFKLNVLLFFCISSCENQLLKQPENSDLINIYHVVRSLSKDQKAKIPHIYTELSKIPDVAGQFDGPVKDPWGNEYLIKVEKNIIFVMSKGKHQNDSQDDLKYQNFM